MLLNGVTGMQFVVVFLEITGISTLTATLLSLEFKNLIEIIDFGYQAFLGCWL